MNPFLRMLAALFGKGGASTPKATAALGKLFGSNKAAARRAAKSMGGEVIEAEAVQDTRKPGRPGEKREGVQMVRVQSSNVHSIGYEDAIGVLHVRYLAPVLHKQPGGGVKIGGKSNAPGPLYNYYDVPPRLWRSFETAPSKGKWVWDNLRIRGTVAGHKYHYRLVSGTVGVAGHRVTYIPRKASGKGFISRTRWQAGRKLKSNFATRKFSSKLKGKQFYRGQ